MPDLAPSKLRGPLAVVCHDAGSTKLVIDWVMADIRVPLQPFMAGPARDLWRAAFPGVVLRDSIADSLDGAAMLLSGTGWASGVEHAARLAARDRGTYSVAVLDHWVNYAVRFERDGVQCLPDALVVSDPWAQRHAQAVFPDISVSLWSNRYLESQIAQITPVRPDGDVLYIGEPARDDWGRNVPGEFQALDFFLQNKELLGIAPHEKVRLRPHPSDEPGKYDAYICPDGLFVIDEPSVLAASINKSKLVVGMNSAALVVALSSGRRVASSLPGWAPRCVLPHEGIIHLCDLVPA